MIFSQVVRCKALQDLNQLRLPRITTYMVMKAMTQSGVKVNLMHNIFGEVQVMTGSWEETIAASR